MSKQTAFEYGEYECLFRDPRTLKALTAIDAAARKVRVKYAVVGGLASFLYTKNPPEDYPDIDVLVYGGAEDAARLKNEIVKDRAFRVQHEDPGDDTEGERDCAFFTFDYGGGIQIDMFTSLDECEPKPTRRIKNVNVESIEHLIIEKLIRSNESDVRMALDLLAYVDYNKKLLNRLGQKYKMTGMIGYAAYWARRLAAGRLNKAGVDNVVRRMVKTSGCI